MLYAFGFERVGVLVGDLYHLDPSPPRGRKAPNTASGSSSGSSSAAR